MSTGTQSPASARADESRVFRPASNPVAATVGLLLGLLLLILVVVGIRDLVLALGWASGDQWGHAGASWLAGAAWQAWMWPVAVLVALIGLLMIWAAVRPRTRGYRRLAGHPEMWTRPGDVARRCSAAVREVPGVDAATTVVHRRRATVTVKAGPAADEAAIRQRAEESLAVLEHTPKAKVRITRRGAGPGG